MYAVYSAELSESQFIGNDPHANGDFPIDGVELFCQRCAESIVFGDYCYNCAQLLGMPFLSDGAPDQFVCPPSPGCEGGDVRHFMNDGSEVQSAFSRRGGAEGVSTPAKEQMNDRFGPEVQRLADGSVPGRFPILRDPKAFHLAHGHPVSRT